MFDFVLEQKQADQKASNFLDIWHISKKDKARFLVKLLLLFSFYIGGVQSRRRLSDFTTATQQVQDGSNLHKSTGF